MSAIALAHMGDAVYETLVRTWLCVHGTATGKDLHRATIALVCAPAQAEKMPVVNAGANRSGDMQYVSIEGGAGTSYYSPLYVQVVD